KPCLWLVRMAKDDISKLHENELFRRYNFEGYNLDLDELCSIFVSLPEIFHNDEKNLKYEWKERLKNKIKHLMNEMENKETNLESIRIDCYRDIEPFIDDRESLHKLAICEAPKNVKRKSFTDVCQRYSLLSKERMKDTSD